MASKNMVMGTGAALAGVGGLAAAAITANPPTEKTVVKTVAQPVETRTVVIRKVEHRTKRIKPKHHSVATAAVSRPAPVVRAAPAVVQATPIVQPAPVAVARPITHAAPIRTHTSGGAGRAGGEHEGGDGAEHNDD